MFEPSKSGFFRQLGCGVPKHLVKSLQTLVDNKDIAFSNSERVEMVGLHINYYPGQQAPHLISENRKYFHTNAMFHGANERAALKADVNGDQALVDYLPILLSEAPLLFKSGKFPLDVALVQVSPPDRHGYWYVWNLVNIYFRIVL